MQSVTPVSLCIRVDASPAIGAGHAMRCLALAQAAKAQGISVRMVGRFALPWVRDRLMREGISCTFLAGEVPHRESAQDMLAQVGKALEGEWLVFDGYHFDYACQVVVREAGYSLVVMDDYCHLPEYSCDILLNPNLGAETCGYQGKIGHLCLGLSYALLRQEFVKARPLALARILVSKPQKLLLTLGGGDFSASLERIAHIFGVTEMSGCLLRIVAGATSVSYIREVLACCPATIEIIQYVEDMPSLLLDTDLCITAGGSTCWELCCMNTPFLTVEVAENQHSNTYLLQVLYDIPQLSFDAFRQYLHAAPPYGKHLIDGAGAARVLQIANTYYKNAQQHNKTSLRPVNAHDKNGVFELINDTLARKFSINSQLIPYESHSKWFDAAIDLGIPLYIVEFADDFCGYIRFSIDTSIANISMAIMPKYRNLGIGACVIQKGLDRLFQDFGITEVHAYISEDNVASQKLFKKAHFIPHDQICIQGRIFLIWKYVQKAL